MWTRRDVGRAAAAILVTMVGWGLIRLRFPSLDYFPPESLMLDLELLPTTVRGFSGLLPSTYAMQAYRGFAFDAETILDPTMSVIVLAIGGVMALGLAVALFSWDRKNATRRMHPAVAILVIVPFLVGTLLA